MTLETADSLFSFTPGSFAGVTTRAACGAVSEVGCFQDRDHISLSSASELSRWSYDFSAFPTPAFDIRLSDGGVDPGVSPSAPSAELGSSGHSSLGTAGVWVWLKGVALTEPASSISGVHSAPVETFACRTLSNFLLHRL